MNDKWEVKVEEYPGSWEVKIYLFRRNAAGRPAMVHIGKDGMVELTEIKPADVINEPTMALNRDAWIALKRALTDNIVAEKQDIEKALEASDRALGATEYHLEDLRKLLKLSGGKK